MSAKYDPAKIEPKWQRYWKANGLFRAKTGSKKRKFYPLVEFPYPSGEGLHTGHVRGYTAMDIIARRGRHEGCEVLYPIGWDAFGLPTENYAVKTGIHPEKVTKKNTDTFRKQLQSLGFSFDWSREIDTTDPEYYQWTQWIFLQLFKKGLAYKAKMDINWCPSCKIGLANEEAAGNVCERCGSATEKREKEQWMLAITKYADRLDRDLDTVDYWDKIKVQQRNWIGRSEGAGVKFIVKEQGTRNKEQECSGIGCLLRTKAGRFLFQERDTRTDRDPGMITPFGGRREKDESLLACVRRELYEELGLDVSTSFIETVGDFPSRNTPGETIRMFIIDGIDESKLVLSEGKRIISLTPTQALKHRKVTDFTKEVIESLVEDREKCIEVFTTRVDTIFGCTYVVVAPEHPLVNLQLTTHNEQQKISNSAEVKEYVEAVKKKTEEERMDAAREKTGVRLEGMEAVNPFTGESVPVFVADYCVGTYGTGAVMAVPAHDERDFAFARKYGLPIRQSVAPFFSDNEGKDAVRPDKPTVRRKTAFVLLKHWNEEKYLCLDWEKFGWHSGIIGGIENGEDSVQAATREIIEETGYQHPKFVRFLGGEMHTNFFAAHKDVNRYAEGVGMLFQLEDSQWEKPSEEETVNHKTVWISAGEMDSFLNLKNFQYMWDVLDRGNECFTADGVLVDSGEFSGLPSEEARTKMTAWLVEKKLGKKQTNYKLRDWVFSRQRYWGEPIPLVFCMECKKRTLNKQLTTDNEGEILNPGWVPVPEKDLPVKLPKVKSYTPTDTGESPLATMEKWVRVKCPRCGGEARRETDTMPNWAGSSWYYLRYADPENAKALASRRALTYWTPVDWYNGGMEHTTLHLLYSRFWHKFLYDIGVVPTKEPYKKRTSHGLILAEGGVKMSKSKGNVVNPDDIVRRFGADTLRVYEMFMGPFDQNVAWSTESIAGSRRFLEKVWNIQLKIKNEKLKIKDGKKFTETKQHISLLHKTIRKVSEDIEGMRFNTAVSALMILANEMEKAGAVARKDFETFLVLLSPFAPHIAEELWSRLGNTKSIAFAAWPKADPKFLKEETVELVVQVNGKLRARLAVPVGASREAVERLAREEATVRKHLDAQTIRKVVFVPDRLINFVI